ncbi:MAG: phenylalanine--tRNA ligase subunit beta [Pseudomonadota bacterium]
MRISIKWLQEFIDLKALSIEQISEQLTMLGLEVEAVENLQASLKDIVVAKVVDVKPHPNADRLRICQVDRGDSQLLQVVCGAANVKAGINVAFAPVGARLPNSLKIKKSKIRGEVSLGMICSEAELHLADDADGIMILADDAVAGMAFTEYLKLDDVIIEVAVTPNRGDCLSMLGIARELAAANRLKLNPIALKTVAATVDNKITIELQDPKLCSQYVGRIVKNVNTQVASPTWLQQRLEKAGIRPISVIVDITNYVMLELGQPMHAFDLDQIEDKIHVRMANAGEALKLLNDTTINLNEEMLVIADAKKPLALAGVMGGLDSSVTDNTKNILLESAFFNPQQISKTLRYYGIHTDSSYRFERGVDPALQLQAMERASQLIKEIAGGEFAPVCSFSHNDLLPQARKICLDITRVKKILGIELDSDRIKSILTSLNLTIETQTASILQVSVPSYRFDLKKGIDLIEEIARIHGYQNIPIHQPLPTLPLQWQKETEIAEATLITQLKALGYSEVISYSFIDAKLQELYDEKFQPLKLLNPISQEMSVMRTSLVPMLLQIYQYNDNRQQSRSRLFEIGRTFLQTDAEIKQDKYLTGLIAGPLYPEQWGVSKRQVDFFDIKGDIETLLQLGKTNKRISFKPLQHSGLHPEQSAEIYMGKQSIGYCGKIHPKLTEQLDISDAIYVFEIQLKSFLSKEMPKYKPISKYPSIRRDIALVVDNTVAAGEIISQLHDLIGKVLVDVFIFDLFSNKKLGENKKSIGIGLILQDISHTLIDDEVNSILSKVVTHLKQEFKADLRE